MNYVVRTIQPEELEKMNSLFMVADYECFIRERAERIINRDADIYVVEFDNRFIGEVTIVYNNKTYEDYTIPKKGSIWRHLGYWMNFKEKVWDRFY